MSHPIPPGYHTITPVLTMKDAKKAISFYEKAFGAKTKYIMPGPAGVGVLHSEIQIGDSIVMLSDEQPGQACQSAESLGGSSAAFYVYVPDVDNAFTQAARAGAKEKHGVSDMFWGDRLGSVEDPFGITWTLATHTRDVSDQEIAAAARQMFGGVEAGTA